MSNRNDNANTMLAGKNIIATLDKTPKDHKGALNCGQEKETVATRTLVAMRGDEMVEAVDVRFYMGRSKSASVVHCSVWCRNNALYLDGRGQAGGHGYCKRSAAFADAVSDIGIKLSQDIDGRGETAIEAAMHAIADALGCGPVRTIVSRG